MKFVLENCLVVDIIKTKKSGGLLKVLVNKQLLTIWHEDYSSIENIKIDSKLDFLEIDVDISKSFLKLLK